MKKDLESLSKYQKILFALNGINVFEDERTKELNIKPGLYLPIQKHLLKPHQLEKSFAFGNSNEGDVMKQVFFTKDSPEFENIHWVYNDETYMGDYDINEVKDIDKNYIFNLINVVRNDEHCDCSIGKTSLDIHKNVVELRKSNSRNETFFYYRGATSDEKPFMEDVIMEAIYQYVSEIYKDYFKLNF